MHESLHISAYTPSNTEPEILEQMFVQREVLLSQTVKWCEESILTKKKNHLIFVGPRGSGKTHFISMVVNRLKEKAKIDKKLDKKLRVVWLGEDDVITNFIDLVLSILETMVRDYPNDFDKECLKDAKGEKPDKAAEIILHSITNQIEGQTILLVKENMSDVFDGLKDNGQKKFRAYLQEQRNISILATSQQLFEGVSSRDNAFFGFFDVHHLETLNVEEARQLIKNIALINGDQELADFLESPEGNYRIRALHHLAGGNHRLYVELAAFLTMESLDDFVSALSKLADNLTPYFQERVKSLPPQQGKIVQKLCELEGATPVKTIAEETFIGERSVAKQLGDLAKKGYVVSHKRGKQSYYEMAEPLMRLSLEVKNNHGRPLKMVASLLRVWFSDDELIINDQADQLIAEYRNAALTNGQEILKTLKKEVLSNLSEEIVSENHSKIISISSEILNRRDHVLTVDEKVILLTSRAKAYAAGMSITKAIIDALECLNLLNDPSFNDKFLIKEDFKSYLYSIVNFEQNAAEITFNILDSIVQSDPKLWEKNIIHLLSSPDDEVGRKHLYVSLTVCIVLFVEDKKLHLFEKWNDLWQLHAKIYEDMEIPLKLLDAVNKSLQEKNDKPLLSLPKELRGLVMPYMGKVLS